MPTNTYSTLTFSGAEATVLATENAYAPKGLTMDLTYLQADTDGNKYVKAGAILAKLSTGLGRVLGLTRLSAIATASSTTALTVDDGLNFKAGESIIVARPYASVTLALNWDTDDTMTVTLDGQAFTVTPGSATVATGATNAAAALNALPQFAAKAEAYATGAVIYVFSKTMKTYSFAASEATTGDGTATASGTVLLSGVSVGTVHASTAPTATTLTLAAASAVTLPVDAPIGVYVAPNDIYGLTANKYLLSSTASEVDEMVNDLAAYDEGVFYQSRLPYWDDAISEALPKISLV